MGDDLLLIKVVKKEIKGPVSPLENFPIKNFAIKDQILSETNAQKTLVFLD